MKETDGRKNNHGVKGNKGGGRPKTEKGARPRHMYTAFDDEDKLIRGFIRITKNDIGQARMLLDY